MHHRPLQPGDYLHGRYVIVRIHHMNSTGALYEAAEEGASPGLRCAIKERAIEASGEAYSAQARDFLRRSAQLAVMDHPALPAFVDSFVEEGCTYLVTAFINGRDLDDLLFNLDDDFSVEQVQQWGLELCDVLSYLHSFQPDPVVFRDLKPANIVIGEDGHARLVDLDTLMLPPGVPASPLGTEGYAAPEQYEGVVSPAIDIYALGAVLHHLLTRCDPRLEPPFSFAARPIRAFNPAVPPLMEAAIMKALSEDAGARFASAAEMAAALTQCNLE